MKITVVARGYYVFRLLICLSAGLVLSASFLRIPGLKGQVLVGLFIYFMFTYLFYRITAEIDKAEVDLEVTSEGLTVTWCKQFFLFKKENRKILWHEIDSYVFEPDQHFDIFKIRLKSKEKIKFNLKETSADFFAFYSAFERMIDEKKSIDPTFTIGKAKTFYETTFALFMACLLSLMITGMVGFMIFGESRKTPNYGLLISSVGGAVFFVFQVYTHRRR